MPITLEDSYELAEFIGTNWNKDPQWHGTWITNYGRMIYATFKDYDLAQVKRAVFTIIQDNTSSRVPPFAEIKEFIIKRCGAERVKRYNDSSLCGLCSDGTRRIIAQLSISGSAPRRYEWVARCTCPKGKLNTKALNHEDFKNLLLDPSRGYMVLGYGKSNPQSIDIIDWAVSTYSEHHKREVFKAGTEELAPIPEHMLARKRGDNYLEKLKETLASLKETQ